MAPDNQGKASDLPGLLRFLTQTASVPLRSAMALAKPLHEAFMTPEKLASLSAKEVEEFIKTADQDGTLDPEKKLARSISNAAKRAAKKRGSTDSSTGAAGGAPASNKKQRSAAGGDLESRIALPQFVNDEDQIRATTVYTNRAPLMLAFVVVMLRYTMPSQPESSRLSLAQAVVSKGARAKARSIGLEKTPAKESEVGPGKGYKSMRIMGNDIAVLVRGHGSAHYEDAASEKASGPDGKSQDETKTHEQRHTEPIYWGLDIERLQDAAGTISTELPIHTPESARSYLLRSFDTASVRGGTDPAGSTKTKKSQASAAEARTQNLAKLLGTLDLVFASWASTLDAAELDRRAWNWYTRVRPDVAPGKQGWGGKGEVRLGEILDLRRIPNEDGSKSK